MYFSQTYFSSVNPLMLIKFLFNFQVPNLNRSVSANPRTKPGMNRSMSHEPNGVNKLNGRMANIDLNDPAIQAKIGNRATKTVEKTIGNDKI